jgi:uncharacterized membrane protein YebE (DUF533 family)
MPEATIRSYLDRLLREGNLDTLLAEGRALAQRGEDAAAERLGIADDPAARDRMRKAGLAGGAALGIAAMLLGGRRRNRFSRNALLLGGIGALGKIAFDAWQQKQGQPRALADLSDDEGEGRARTLLYALVAAAKADGHIDDEEHSAIEAELEDAPEAVKGLIGEAMARPADPEAIAAMVRDEAEGREVYAASALLCGRDHPDETAYLDRLARALGLSDEEARRIEGGLQAA